MTKRVAAGEKIVYPYLNNKLCLIELQRIAINVNVALKYVLKGQSSEIRITNSLYIKMIAMSVANVLKFVL